MISMDESMMRKIFDRIVEMVENIAEKKPGYLVDSGNSTHADVDLRRIAVLIGTNLGIRSKIMADKFDCKQPKIFSWTGVARNERYGKTGHDDFTKAVDVISAGIVKEYPDVGPDTQGPSPKPEKVTRRPAGTRGKEKKVKKHRKYKKRISGDQPERYAAKFTDDTEMLSVALYALAEVEGVSTKLLSESCGISFDGVKIRIGDVHLRLSQGNDVLNARLLSARAMVDLLKRVMGMVK